MAIRSAQPDLPLIVLTCGATLVGGAYAPCLGLFAGYLCVALTPTISFGSYLVSRTVAGAAAGGLTRSVIRDSVWTPPIVVTLGTAVAEIVFALMAPSAWLHHFRRYLMTAGGEVVYNAALSYPVYVLLRRLGIGFRPEDPYAPPR
jgi:hypothetical protein